MEFVCISFVDVGSVADVDAYVALPFAKIRIGYFKDVSFFEVEVFPCSKRYGAAFVGEDAVVDGFGFSFGGDFSLVDIDDFAEEGDVGLVGLEVYDECSLVWCLWCGWVSVFFEKGLFGVVDGYAIF